MWYAVTFEFTTQQFQLCSVTNEKHLIVGELRSGCGPGVRHNLAALYWINKCGWVGGGNVSVELDNS